jgi:hypothetical protein
MVPEATAARPHQGVRRGLTAVLGTGEGVPANRRISLLAATPLRSG